MSQRVLPPAVDIGRLQEVLAQLDVRSRWHGWDTGHLIVETPDGDELVIPCEP
jgi:Cft2 family RNA processing exonuclease